MNYVPLLIHAIDLVHQSAVEAAIAGEGLDRRALYAKYRKQSLWLLVPFVVGVAALAQMRRRYPCLILRRLKLRCEFCLRPGTTSSLSIRASLADPSFEYRDLLCRPGSVAWHSAGSQACQDRLGVGPHVWCRPQIEGEAHRPAVARTKQTLDVPFVAQYVARLGNLRCREIRDGDLRRRM